MSAPSPAKKLCLSPCSGRGKKNVQLQAEFEPAGGDRVRCKRCKDKWFRESVQVNISSGMAEAAAIADVSARVPPVSSVPTFNKAGTETLKGHLLKVHDEDVGFGKSPSGQSTLQAAFQNPTKKSPSDVKAALVSISMS